LKVCGEGRRRGGRRADTRMPLRESEAIILRSYPLGEADRLVSFLSRSTGRLRGVARGARRTRSRFGSTLEPLSHIRIWFFERETRELVRINQCELIESFLEAQRDYACGVGLALVSEVTEAVLPEREPADASFRLVLVTARAIQRRAGIALPLAYFGLWTVRLGGWLPQLDRCARCGRAVVAEGVFGSPMFAGLACANCRRPGMRTISAAALALAGRILLEKLEHLAEEDWPAAPLDELNTYLLDLIEHQIERKLTTRRMLEAKLEPSS
jgi:DNA repair protein RecO (recombination protein O)